MEEAAQDGACRFGKMKDGRKACAPTCPSQKPVSIQRSRSSSAAALDGAQIRMRGLAATFGNLDTIGFHLP